MLNLAAGHERVVVITPVTHGIEASMASPVAGLTGNGAMVAVW